MVNFKHLEKKINYLCGDINHQLQADGIKIISIERISIERF